MAAAEPLTEAQVAALVRPVPGTDEEAVFVEDLQERDLDSVDSLTDLESPLEGEEPDDMRLASPGQHAAVAEALQREMAPARRKPASPVTHVIMDMSPERIQAAARSRSHATPLSTPDMRARHTAARTPSLESKSNHSLLSNPTYKLRQLSGGVAGMPHIPSWMMNPALGGFNPLPSKQPLRASVCTRYVMKRDEPESFTEALVRQAEQMIANEKNFFRRGSVSGWKIKPVTATKSNAATTRVGGIRPRSSALPPAGAGFFFDESRALTPHTVQHLAEVVAQVSVPDIDAGEMRPHHRASGRLTDKTRPSSLPANGLLPEPGAYSHHALDPGTGDLSGHNDSISSLGDAPRTRAPGQNFLTRPSRQRRKLPLEGLTPSGRSDLAARPPAWLEPMQSRAAIRNLAEAPPRISALGSDLYLKHVRETQRQLDEMLTRRPEELQGRGRTRRSRRGQTEVEGVARVHAEQSSRTGLLR